MKQFYESFNFSEFKCVFYRYACQDIEQHYEFCTETEIKLNTLIPVYSISTKSTALDIISPDYSDQFVDAMACSSNDCNDPSYLVGKMARDGCAIIGTRFY